MMFLKELIVFILLIFLRQHLQVLQTKYSRYSGAFDLLDTFRYPKMCASQSVNLTNGVTYYRAQWKYGY